MQRLSSYFIYLICVASPLLPAVVIYSDIDSILKADIGSIVGAIFYLGIACYFIFFISRSKRVFYKDSSLYIYNLFSKKLLVVDKNNIGGINPFMQFNPTIYTLVYYNENKDAKYVFIIRNPLCTDFSAIIDKLNY